MGSLRLIDIDRGSDSSVKTSIRTLLAKTGRFSEAELADLTPGINAAIREGRDLWVSEELPIIVGRPAAAIVKNSLETQTFDY